MSFTIDQEVDAHMTPANRKIPSWYTGRVTAVLASGRVKVEIATGLPPILREYTLEAEQVFKKGEGRNVASDQG